MIAAALALGASYDNVLLKIHAKVFPKMIMTDTEIARKSFDGSIVIGIVYESGERSDAEHLKRLIGELYPRIGAYALRIELYGYRTFLGKPEVSASALFLLNGSSRNLQHAVSYAKEHSIVTYAYNPAYLKQGVLMSLYIDQKTRPYLNLSEAKSYNIRFSNILLKIAKLL
jgi:hypothetical protein